MSRPKTYMTFSIFGSRALFWLLAPWLLASVPTFAYLAVSCFREDNLTGILISVVLTICCLSGLLLGVSIRRFGWTAIFITLAIPAGYIWYFCDTFFVEGQRITPTARRAESTPWNAIMGFIVFGVPCLIASFMIIRGWLSGGPQNAANSTSELRSGDRAN